MIPSSRIHSTTNRSCVEETKSQIFYPTNTSPRISIDLVLDRLDSIVHDRSPLLHRVQRLEESIPHTPYSRLHSLRRLQLAQLRSHALLQVHQRVWKEARQTAIGHAVHHIADLSPVLADAQEGLHREVEELAEGVRLRGPSENLNAAVSNPRFPPGEVPRRNPKSMWMR